MSILIDEKTPILVQGITGDKGSFHAREMVEYGSRVVAGVTPGKGGRSEHGVPVFDTVRQAVRETGAEASITFVAPPFAADAIMEAADAGIRLICSITDGIPAQDMMRVKRYLRRYPKERRPMVVGPNCAGIISPGKSMLGIMPGHIYLKGNIGVISRSGTLGYEAAAQMKAVGLGISTSVGIGGDPINGSSFLDHLALFEEDPDTEAVLMIGEIGGPQEAEAAAWIQKNMSKPVVGFVAGLTAPKGRKMGHAGAIISAAGDSAGEKAEIMRSYGLTVAPSPGAFGTTMAEVMATRRKAREPTRNTARAHPPSPRGRGEGFTPLVGGEAKRRRSRSEGEGVSTSETPPEIPPHPRPSGLLLTRQGISSPLPARRGEEEAGAIL